MRSTITKSIQDSIAAKELLLKSHTHLIELATERVILCLKAGRKVLFFGNGGSASDSQHLAAEFVGRYEKERRSLAAIALTTDTSILTAVGNDYGYDRIFERQIEGLGHKGDVAFAISTSGNSKNVILAAKKAQQMGLYVIGLTGGTGGDLIHAVDLPIIAPSGKTARIQECHILIGHIICECVDTVLSQTT